MLLSCYFKKVANFMKDIGSFAQEGPMQQFTIPTCYFPSTAVFVDDSRDFLLNFVYILAEFKTKVYGFYNQRRRRI